MELMQEWTLHIIALSILIVLLRFCVKFLVKIKTMTTEVGPSYSMLTNFNGRSVGD